MAEELEEGSKTSSQEVAEALVDTARKLLSLERVEDLQEALKALDPERAAQVVLHAPSLEAKTRLLWAMEQAQRAEVMDHLSPILIAALVQNLEIPNVGLLGNLSRQTYLELLNLCSPSQQFYWLFLACQSQDPSAQMLPLFLEAETLARILLTSAEFRELLPKLTQIGPRDIQLTTADPHLQEELKVRRHLHQQEVIQAMEDSPLKEILHHLVELDSELLDEAIHQASLLLDYERSHPEEQRLKAEPILLPEESLKKLLEPPVGVALPQHSTGGEAGGEEIPASPAWAPLPILAPREVAENKGLLQQAFSGLPEERLPEIQRQLGDLFEREIIDMGGSFHVQDMEIAINRVRFYLHAGLLHLSKGHLERVSSLLHHISLEQVYEAGNQVVELLRQQALRLLVYQDRLDLYQQEVLKALLKPDIGVEYPAGRFVIFLKGHTTRRRVLGLSLTTIQEMIHHTACWLALVRHLSEGPLKDALRRARERGYPVVLRHLLLSGLFYHQWTLDLLQLEDMEALLRRYYLPEERIFKPEVKAALVEFAQGVADFRRLPTATPEGVTEIVTQAIEGMEIFLREHPHPSPQEWRRLIHFATD